MSAASVPVKIDKMKQELESTQTEQVTRDSGTKVPFLFMKVKQETDYELFQTSYGRTHTGNVKTEVHNIDSCSMNMTEVETVPQTGLCEEDDKKLIKDEISHCAQWYLTNSHVDIQKEDMDSLNPFQHSLDGTPIARHSDETGDFKKLLQHNENTMTRTENISNICVLSTMKSRNQRLNECTDSINIMDCKVFGEDIMVKNNQKMALNNSCCDRLSENEYCSSKKCAKQVSRACSEICCVTETNNSKSGQERLYSCNLCGLKLIKFSLIKTHTQRHLTDNLYKCNICGRGFTKRYHLSRHKRTHTGEKPYKCDVCGLAFIDSCGVKSHKRTHTGEKPYKCDVCGLGFSDSGGVKRHRRTHTGEKPYKCDVCGLGFAQTGTLKKHKMTHTGEKPYKCDVCGVGFAQTRYLKRHRVLHTREKPYKCDVCGLGFAQTHYLKKHRLTHTGEKPYKCDMCGVGFTTISSLKRHKRTHTGEKPFKHMVSNLNGLVT